MKIFLIIASFIVNAVYAEELFLQGNVGKYPVVMELNIVKDDNKLNIYGQYVYQNKITAIQLDGNSLSNLKEFKQLPMNVRPNEYDKKVNAVFNGQLESNSYKGKWKLLSTGKVLDFDLKVIPRKTENTSYTSEFSKELLKRITFKKENNSTNQNGILLQGYIEPVTKEAGFRISGLINKKAENNINDFLGDYHKYSVMESLECMSGYDGGYTHSLESGRGGSGVDYYKPPFLQVFFAGSTYCGAAHPNNYHYIYSFDTNTGKQIDITAMFEVFKQVDEYPKKLTSEFKRILNLYLKDRNCAKDAKDVYEASEGNIKLFVEKDNYISVHLYELPYVIFACGGNIADIPIEKLKVLAKPTAYKYFYN